MLWKLDAIINDIIIDIINHFMFLLWRQVRSWVTHSKVLLKIEVWQYSDISSREWLLSDTGGCVNYSLRDMSFKKNDKQTSASFFFPPHTPSSHLADSLSVECENIPEPRKPSDMWWWIMGRRRVTSSRVAHDARLWEESMSMCYFAAHRFFYLLSLVIVQRVNFSSEITVHVWRNFTSSTKV